MITSTTTDEAERRTRVKQLAGISRSYSDDELDVKIEAADAIATALFREVPADGTPRLENLITVANLHAAILILSGIDRDAAVERVAMHRETIQSIMEAANRVADAQNPASITVTTPAGGGTFS